MRQVPRREVQSRSRIVGDARPMKCPHCGGRNFEHLCQWCWWSWPTTSRMRTARNIGVLWAAAMCGMALGVWVAIATTPECPACQMSCIENGLEVPSPERREEVRVVPMPTPAKFADCFVSETGSCADEAAELAVQWWQSIQRRRDAVRASARIGGVRLSPCVHGWGQTACLRGDY